MAAETPPDLVIAEPAGRFATRPPIVVDSSVLASILFDEPQRDTAANTLRGRELFAPDLIDHELVSVGLKKLSLGREDGVLQGLTDLAELRLSRRRVDTREQLRLAAELDLTAYDAAYLVLAAALRAPLATFDRRLGEAATAYLGGT